MLEEESCCSIPLCFAQAEKGRGGKKRGRLQHAPSRVAQSVPSWSEAREMPEGTLLNDPVAWSSLEEDRT